MDQNKSTFQEREQNLADNTICTESPVEFRAISMENNEVFLPKGKMDTPSIVECTRTRVPHSGESISFWAAFVQELMNI